MSTLETLKMDATPKIDDTVYFYFRHAFCEPDGPPGHPGRFTGKMEMRCRPARVVRVVPDLGHLGLEPTEGFQPIPIIHLDLVVEFQSDDRLLAPGGVGLKFRRDVGCIPSHLGPEGPGTVGRAWPDHGRWAYTPMLD